MSSTTVTRGNSHETFYIAPSLTPAIVSASLTTIQSFQLPGLQATDLVQVIGYNGNQTAGIVVAQAECLAANVLTVQFGNASTSAATPASGVYNMQIVRLEGPAPVTAV
jgi:hypothetical protein